MRIVISSWGSYGDLFPYIGLGVELKRRGHHPVLATSAAYQPLVEREGLAFHAVRPDIDIHDRELAAKIMDPARGPAVIFGEVLIPRLAESHADLMEATRSADAVLTHPAMPAAVIAAQERKLPWISSVLAPLSFFSAHDPVAPAPAPWVQPILAKSLALSRSFLWLTDLVTRKWARPIEEFRAARGLVPAGNPIMSGQHSPRLVLAMFSKLLAAAQPDWPAHVHVTGAVMYNGAQSPALPPELSAFLDAGAAPIVFTLGTSAVAAAGKFYDVTVEAVDRLGVRAVLLVGPFRENRPAAMSERIHLAEFASHAALFPRAAVVVHQGGAGTLHQALASGRPMLVVPHSHDQPDNARRVAALGVARTLSPRHYTVSTVTRELRTLMSPAYIDRAAQAAGVVRSEDGARAAVDAIEDSLRS